MSHSIKKYLNESNCEIKHPLFYISFTSLISLISIVISSYISYKNGFEDGKEYGKVLNPAIEKHYQREWDKNIEDRIDFDIARIEEDMI
ncbi:MAG: hypothetical protein QW727_03015 [Candidatus Pacearchaeota archaeon]